MSRDSYLVTIDLLNELAEFLEGQQDVVDGSYGEPQPNKAMSLLGAVEGEIERLKRSPGPNDEVKRFAAAFVHACDDEGTYFGREADYDAAKLLLGASIATGDSKS